MDAAFRRAVAEARRHEDLSFAGLLSEDRILQAFGRARWLWHGWIYRVHSSLCILARGGYD
jgi:hypothetical protein